jgi:hypothetical protein
MTVRFYLKNERPYVCFSNFFRARVPVGWSLVANKRALFSGAANLLERLTNKQCD